MNHTVSLDDETYTDLYQTYQNIGENLQSALDTLLNEINTMIESGHIEGPVAVALKDLEATIRQDLQQRILPLTSKRGSITSESVYNMEIVDC